MREVDLFVAETSIALDPNWVDRGDDPHLTYWQAFSFAELTETAAVRRDALARLIPKLKIAGQLELCDRYLCIVPAGSGRPKVMLPFDGDHVLSVILSKALLLAADDKITDPAILQQLKQTTPTVSSVSLPRATPAG